MSQTGATSADPADPADRAGPRSRRRWQLTDLIGLDALQSIQDTFARAFGVPTVILDADGADLTAITHRVSFCEDLTRASPVAGPRCSNCDVAAMRKAGDGASPAIFKCWNGLYDCAIPIAPKGEVLGYFLCGQILTAPPDRASYARTACDIGVDPDRYLAALDDVAVLPYERYEASVQSMHVLAEMIADQAAASIDSLRTLEEARQAKEDTAQLVDELDTLLEALRDIASRPDYQATLTAIADNLTGLVPWDSCVIYLTDEESNELIPVVVRDPSSEALAAYRPRLGEGVIGTAALGGAARRLEDITQDPTFEPVPGVAVEPESALVAPMLYKGTVSGVIALSRFERRTFSAHELRILEMFSSQAAVSIKVAKLASEDARRLNEERAFGRLRVAMAGRTNVRSMLEVAADVGIDLMDADAAVATASEPGVAPTTVYAGLAGEPAAEALLSELAPTISRCTELGQPEVVPRRTGSAAVVPLAPVGQGALAVFVREQEAPWDGRLLASFAAQAGLGVENIRMRERERRVLLEYQRLSELATELVAARDADQVRGRLTDQTAAIVSADACFTALFDAGPDAVRVELRHGREREQRTIRLRGGARVAALRLLEEPAADRSVFDSWSEQVFSAVGEAAGLRTWLAEPLRVPTGALGGLFVGWRSGEVQPSRERRRILGVLAGAAGAALARFAAYAATDSILRERVLELEAFASLAQRISGLTSSGAVVDELLSLLCQVGSLDGAVYGAATEGGLVIRRAANVESNTRSALMELLDSMLPMAESARVTFGDEGLQAIVIPMSKGTAGDSFFAGVGPAVDDRQRDRVMATLVRYGAVALENAHLHDSQREAIDRLEHQHVEIADQFAKLERILSVHETLAAAVLEGRGLPSVLQSLGRFMNAEMLVLAPDERVLASWPPKSTIDWRPPTSAEHEPHTVVAPDGDARLIAAPAVVEGMTLAWIIARTTSSPGEVERAAVEYGALLVALDLLRERTAIEVETRLRGGLLEDLFGGETVAELVLERAHAFGYDLSRPSRVFLVDGAPSGGESTPAQLDPEQFYVAAAACARDWCPENLVAVRGSAIAVIVPDNDRRFEEVLLEGLRAKFPGTPFTIAVGTRCEQFEDYAHSYLGARRGLDLLRLLGRSNEIFSLRESTLESMLLQSARPEVILSFIARYVEPLDRYDRGHRSDLRRTLEVYYEASGNLEEAARRLHIHVSTLRYRLKKAGALIRLDPKQGPGSLDLQVALRVARVLAVQGG